GISRRCGILSEESGRPRTIKDPCGCLTLSISGGAQRRQLHAVVRRPPYAVAHSEERSAACSRTVCVAFSCLSGGYPCLRRIRLTRTRSCARTFSRSVQSMVTLL